MPVTRDDIASVLERASSPIAGLLTPLGSPGAIVAPIVEQALGLAADLVRAGDDAAVVIQRIRRSPELLEQMRAEARWEAKLDDKFPPATTPPGPDTEPGGPPINIYDDEEG